MFQPASGPRSLFEGEVRCVLNNIVLIQAWVDCARTQRWLVDITRRYFAGLFAPFFYVALHFRAATYVHDLLDAPTALAACCGFDLCHKYILYFVFCIFYISCFCAFKHTCQNVCPSTRPLRSVCSRPSTRTAHGLHHVRWTRACVSVPMPGRIGLDGLTELPFLCWLGACSIG